MLCSFDYLRVVLCLNIRSLETGHLILARGVTQIEKEDLHKTVLPKKLRILIERYPIETSISPQIEKGNLSTGVCLQLILEHKCLLHSFSVKSLVLKGHPYRHCKIESLSTGVWSVSFADN